MLYEVITVEDVTFVQRRHELAAQFHDRVDAAAQNETDRITSYNVCYTKLLRVLHHGLSPAVVSEVAGCVIRDPQPMLFGA